MQTIAIYCKASFQEGLGHVVRQLNLARALDDTGIDVYFCIEDYPPAIAKIKDHGFPIFTLNSQEQLPGGVADLALLDRGDNTREAIDALRVYAKRIVDFDDLGSGRNAVDLLIDANLGAEDCKNLASNVKTLFGLPYSVLHPEYSKTESAARTYTQPIQSVLISMGGTDPNKLSLRLTQTILNLGSNVMVAVVTGPGFEDLDSFRLFEDNSRLVRRVNNPPHLADLLREHDAVFCSGGVTLHEAAACGTPAFVIGQAEHQKKCAGFFSREGVAVDLGTAADIDEARIADCLALPKETLNKMSHRGKELLDGRGIFRVAEEITALLK